MTEQTAIFETVACPRCGADPASPCTDRHGRTRTYAHASRRRAFQAAGPGLFEPKPYPAIPPRPPRTSDLVTAWVNGYIETHNGEYPHPGLVRPVSGFAKRIGERCATTEHWRMAWHAARAAGRAGRYNLYDFLVHERGGWHPVVPDFPTEEQIDAGRTSKGGYTRATLAAWGVPWPPPTGWREALLRHERPWEDQP